MDKWEREPLTDEEVTAIFDECSTTEERLIVAFLADTGCRVNELLRLDSSWEDTNVGKYGTLTVPVKATSGKRPKTKKPKMIPISKRLGGVFDDMIKNHGVLEVNRTPQHIYNVVKRLAKKAGIMKHVTPHVFRHSFITRCYYKGGLKPNEIAAIVGHAGPDMVNMVYLHIDSEKTRSKLEDAGFLD